MPSERTSPTGIKILYRIFFLLILVNIASEIYLKVTRSTNLKRDLTRFDYFISIHKRNDILVDMGYYIRKYERVAR